MAPPSTRRAPPDPPYTGHRIIKQKNTTTKTNNSNNSSCTILSSLESTRKAEAIRNALGAPQNTEKETPNNVRIASLDLDYPGSDGDSSDDDLIYEDPPYDNFPSASGKIKEALLSVSEAASLRILEARELFDTISGILDVHCQTSDPDMPPAHVRALKDLHEELTAVARRHFEAFVKGISAQTHTDESKDAMNTSNSNNTVQSNQSSKLSYAQVVNHNSRATPQKAHLNNNGSSAKGNSKPNTDERLFLRLPKDDPL
ncbi:hypothetical protein EPUL_001272 [Erysiphe pulchra]|uniref:Uncharacterized protein n=1 Tax=Erysiphe pulchra TaxID=225359 RepID=A0A2S4PYC8_9PEZI|nr:hypothetical protein EPUL_001272 [Erysiphe pulchra]